MLAAMGEPVGWLRAVVIDADDPERLASFWGSILGVGIVESAPATSSPWCSRCPTTWPDAPTAPPVVHPGPIAPPESIAMTNAAITTLLAAPPRPPRDPSLFTSGLRFGVPGIYPQGSPMEPAAGPPIDEADAHRIITDLVPLRDPGALDRSLALLDDPDVVGRIPDPAVRAALALLVPTIAAPLVVSFLDRTSPVETIAMVDMPDSSRTFGPIAGGGRGDRALNGRYAAEHPLAIAPSLVHHLGWLATGDRYEEVLLHGLLAVVHLQWIAAIPGLALTNTELTRRQNSMALTLANSRRPGAIHPSMRADDGPGVIPGGDPALSTPDLWSVPLARESASGAAVPAAVVATFAAAVADPATIPAHLAYDDELADLATIELAGPHLTDHRLLRSTYALGMLDPDELVATTGLDLAAVLELLDLADVESAWSVATTHTRSGSSRRDR